MKFDGLDQFISNDDMSHDVLDDNEDLLHQLSAELGLPDFLQERGGDPLSYDRGAPTSYERGAPTSSSSSSSVEGMEAGTLLEDQLMQDISCFQADNALFPEISSADSAYSGSIKSEPSSPFSEVLMGAPSSPSGSEDNSPPLSPNQQSHSRQFPITTSKSESKVSTVLMNADGSYNILTTAPVSGSNIQTIQGTVPVPPTYGGKIAIPKIRKPVPASTHASSSLSTPLVLQLGNDGLYYTKTAATGPLIVKTEPTCVTGPPTSYCSPMVAGLPTVTSTHSGEDMRNIKRQQRMIKNRESACISRKKKKEYVTNLEDQIKLLSSENMRLTALNENLKAKVRDLESEKKLWTDSILSSSKGKKVTAMFAVLFMVSINFNSLGSLYNKSNNPGPPASKFPVHFPRTEDLHDGPGRSLLWVEDNEVEVEDEEDKVEFPANFTGFGKPPPMCPMFFNQSESIRLESELRGWFNVDVPHKQEEKVHRRRPDSTTKPHEGFKGKIKTKKKDQALGHVIKTPLHSLTGSLYHMLIQEPPSSGKHAVGLYDAPRNTFASFFEAIERRDDTFYVVSFSGDHLLVPATNHSQANRPRMSLLLPALQVSLNESHRGPPGSIAMMKIDCEVMNTQLLHVNQDAIPVHMAANLKTENISGEGDTKRKDSTEYRRDKDVRNKNRAEMNNNEKDNVTMEREGGDLPDMELEEFEGLHKIKNLRIKRKPDFK